MAVTVLFFAQCANLTGRRRVEIPMGEPAVLNDLMEQRIELRPMREHRSSLRVAVNRELTTLEQEIRDGDEIAFMSPFSGG